MSTQSPTREFTTCTGLGCVGLRIDGEPLRCPQCNGTLLRYPRRKPVSSPAMSSVEIEARANARAHAEHVHIFAVPGRPGVYTTRSKSNHAERYALVARDGVEACSCRGFEYRGSCKHVEALRNRLARESMRVTTVAALAGKEAA